VIYSSRKCPAADSRAATATPRIEVQVTEAGSPFCHILF
jgi:hypothetical protein